MKTVRHNVLTGEITETDLTAEEISERETEQTLRQEAEAEKEADKQAKADLKASAKAKLIAGEALTEEEANVLVGV